MQSKDLLQLQKHRAALCEIQERLNDLSMQAAEKKAAAHELARRIEFMKSPEGILEHSDKAIADAEREYRAALRASATAAKELSAYEATDARDLSARFGELDRKIFEEQHRAEREKFFAAVKAFLQLLGEAATLESELDILAVAAGFRRGPRRILTAAYPGAASPVDYFRRQLPDFSEDLLDPTDPALRLWRASRFTPAA